MTCNLNCLTASLAACLASNLAALAACLASLPCLFFILSKIVQLSFWRSDKLRKAFLSSFDLAKITKKKLSDSFPQPLDTPKCQKIKKKNRIQIQTERNFFFHRNFNLNLNLNLQFNSKMKSNPLTLNQYNFVLRST